MKPRIVILDGRLANPGDLLWSGIEALGSLVVYDATEPDQIIERCQNAHVVITNKCRLGMQHFEQLPQLELICLLATGYDNIDIAAAHQSGITVCNAVGYGSASVAQHVFALLLHHTNQVSLHNEAIQNGVWQQTAWSFSLTKITGLRGKTLGLIGYGKIGQEVAQIAMAFGMKVIVHRRSNSAIDDERISSVDRQTIFNESDVISLHLPLNESNSGMINRVSLSQMKPGALLINTARGGHINEQDLRQHLITHPNFTALLDVLSKEPPSEDHPLIGLPNCILTPHNAWANIDARRNLIQIVADNIKGFYNGAVVNEVRIR